VGFEGTQLGSEKVGAGALTSGLDWFDTELLSREENLIGPMALGREPLGQAESLDSSGAVVRLSMTLSGARRERSGALSTGASDLDSAPDSGTAIGEHLVCLTF
jgi:hypothetical protein